MQQVPDGKNLTISGRFIYWVARHRRRTRLIVLFIALIGYFLLVPASIRTLFLIGLGNHKIFASMLVAFSLLAVSLVWTRGQEVDTWAFQVFNLRGRRPIWLDRVMLSFTQIGSGFVGLAIALVLYLSGLTLLAYELILGTLSLWLVVEMVKFVVHRSRPYHRITQARIVGFREIGKSFPSGHTSQAFFIVTLITQQYHANYWYVLLLYAGALFVGITRMYVGAHYPRDVLAGAILGSAWGLLGVMVVGYMLNGIR